MSQIDGDRDGEATYGGGQRIQGGEAAKGGEAAELGEVPNSGIPAGDANSKQAEINKKQEQDGNNDDNDGGAEAAASFQPGSEAFEQVPPQGIRLPPPATNDVNQGLLVNPIEEAASPAVVGQGERTARAQSGDAGAGGEHQQMLTTEATTILGKQEQEKLGDNLQQNQEDQNNNMVDKGEEGNKKGKEGGQIGDLGKDKEIVESGMKANVDDQKQIEPKIDKKLEASSIDRQVTAPRTNVTTSRMQKEPDGAEGEKGAAHESVSQFPSSTGTNPYPYSNQLVIVSTMKPPKLLTSSQPTPQNELDPVITKDRDDIQVKYTPLSSENLDIEQGINQMLQQLEQTVNTYEQKLTTSQTAGSKSGTLRGNEKAQSETEHNYVVTSGPVPSPSSQLDPEKHRKLQEIMKRIKDDIGQIKDALDEEKSSVALPATSGPQSQTSPLQREGIFKQKSQESRGRRQHSSSQISQLNHLIRGGQRPASISGSRIVPEADGALTAKRMKTLKSIFDFYSRQHLNLGRHATFDKIEQSMQRMTLGEFMKLVQDFKVLQEYDMLYHEIKSTCTNAFMAVAENKRDIDFYAFKASLYIIFRIDDQEGVNLQENEAIGLKKRNVAQANSRYTFSERQEPPLMITDGKMLGSATKSSRDPGQVAMSASKTSGGHQPLFDFQDKELIEERIASALLLDKPSQVIMIQQGYMIPFHMKDAKRHSPEKQIQPKVATKTVDLSGIEKEAIRLRIKVMKIERELNRPKANIEKTDQAYKPIRDTFQRLKLPDEKRLKKALAKSVKELEEFEAMHPTEVRALDEKTFNKQNMYEKQDTEQSARPRKLENIQEEYSMAADEDMQDRGDYLAIKDHQEEEEEEEPQQDQASNNGNLYTVPEVDSARFPQQNPNKNRNEEEAKQSEEEDAEDETVAVQEAEEAEEEDPESNQRTGRQEGGTPLESIQLLPEDVTSYYTLDALNQVKTYQHLNKIIDLVKDQNREGLAGSIQRRSQGILGSLGQAVSQQKSHSIISLDGETTPGMMPERRIGIKAPYLFATTTEKTEEHLKTQESQPSNQIDPRKFSFEAPSQSQVEHRNSESKMEQQQDVNQSMFKPSLIGLDDEKQLSELQLNHLLGSANRDTGTEMATVVMPEPPRPQPFERMRASRMNLIANQTPQDPTMPSSKRQFGQFSGEGELQNADLHIPGKPAGAHLRDANGQGNVPFSTLQVADSQDFFAGTGPHPFQPITQRARGDQDSLARNGLRLRGVNNKLGTTQSLNNMGKDFSQVNLRMSDKSLTKLGASKGGQFPSKYDQNTGPRVALKPAFSTGLLHSDEMLPNEKMAREFLENHKRMQQEQRRQDYQYNNRIRDQLDQVIEPPQQSSYHNTIDTNYQHAAPKDLQKYQVVRRERSEAKMGRGGNSSVLPITKDKKSAHGGGVHSKRLEKRIYQVSDLKHMGILKKGPSNQSDNNLRLPAIETALFSQQEFSDGTRPYPNSTLPVINNFYNNFGTVPAQPNSNRAGVNSNSQDSSLAGSRPAQIRGQMPQPNIPLTTTHDAAIAPLIPHNSSRGAPGGNMQKQTSSLNVSKNWINGTKQPAQRGQLAAERSGRGGQRRAGKDVVPDMGQQSANSKPSNQRRTERDEAHSVQTRDSVETLEKNRISRQQAATTMNEVYQVGLERNKLKMGSQFIRNKAQHLRMTSREQALLAQQQQQELHSSIEENPLEDYDYDLPKHQANNYKSNASLQQQSNMRSQQQIRPLAHENQHQDHLQRQGNSNVYIQEDLGEPAMKQLAINQSAPQINIRQQRQPRASRYSQSKQGPGGGVGKPPRQGQPPNLLGQTLGGGAPRQTQSYAQLAKNAKNRKTTTINIDDYNQFSQVPRLSSTSMNKKVAGADDFGQGDYDSTNVQTQSYSQIYQGYTQGYKAYPPSNDPSGILSTHNTSSLQYPKAHASRILHDQSQSFTRGGPPAAHNRLQNHTPAANQLLYPKQQMKNLRILANSVEARTSFNKAPGKPPVALRGLSQSAINNQAQQHHYSQNINYRDF